MLCPVETGLFHKISIAPLEEMVEKLKSQITFYFHVQDRAGRYFDRDTPLWNILNVYQSKAEERIENMKLELIDLFNNKLIHLQFNTDVNQYSFRESLTQYVHSHHIDLLLFAGESTGLFRHLSKNSMEYIVRNVLCPVLIIR